MPPTTLLNGRFTVEVLLGKGGFGEVYSGRDTTTKEPIAVKLERAMSRSWLYHEAKVMQEICTREGIIGVPQLRYFGQQGDYRVLVMTMHGKSLEDLHEELGRFSLKTTAMLLDQMLQRIESFHAAGYIHRDLKPDNFLMGLNNNSHLVYIIDFGLSQRFITNSTHKEMTTGRSFVGTTRYASLNTHKGLSQSRRDDLEQLAYIAVYLHRGRLPWSGLQIADRDEKERVIGDMKEKLTTAQICSRCPRQFEDLLLYARKMSYDEAPQYEMCRMLVTSVLEEMNMRNDFIFDWIQPDDTLRSPMSQSLMSALSSANGHGVLSGVLSDAAVQREQDEIH